MTSSRGIQADFISPVTNFANLNHNILVSIMSALKMHDLINGAARACSSWQAAAKDPNCWSNILHIDKSELLDEIAEWGTLDDFWHILCSVFGDSLWKDKDVVVLRGKDMDDGVYEVG